MHIEKMMSLYKHVRVNPSNDRSAAYLMHIEKMMSLYKHVRVNPET
jgi:membrane protein insertase Oxa1/YidC/SpoIIIJ